jgi:hypothetical protein
LPGWKCCRPLPRKAAASSCADAGVTAPEPGSAAPRQYPPSGAAPAPGAARPRAAGPGAASARDPAGRKWPCAPVALRGNGTTAGASRRQTCQGGAPPAAGSAPLPGPAALPPQVPDRPGGSPPPRAIWVFLRAAACGNRESAKPRIAGPGSGPSRGGRQPHSGPEPAGQPARVMIVPARQGLHPVSRRNRTAPRNSGRRPRPGLPPTNRLRQPPKPPAPRRGSAKEGNAPYRPSHPQPVLAADHAPPPPALRSCQPP